MARAVSSLVLSPSRFYRRVNCLAIRPAYRPDAKFRFDLTQVRFSEITMNDAETSFASDAGNFSRSAHVSYAYADITLAVVWNAGLLVLAPSPLVFLPAAVTGVAAVLVDYVWFYRNGRREVLLDGRPAPARFVSWWLVFWFDFLIAWNLGSLVGYLLIGGLTSQGGIAAAAIFWAWFCILTPGLSRALNDMGIGIRTVTTTRRVGTRLSYMRFVLGSGPVSRPLGDHPVLGYCQGPRAFRHRAADGRRHGDATLYSQYPTRPRGVESPGRQHIGRMELRRPDLFCRVLSARRDRLIHDEEWTASPGIVRSSLQYRGGGRRAPRDLCTSSRRRSPDRPDQPQRSSFCR